MPHKSQGERAQWEPSPRSGEQVLRERMERVTVGKILGEGEAGGEDCAVHQLYGERGRGESGSK